MMSEIEVMAENSNIQNQQAGVDQPMVYQIRVKGHLSHKWADWFEGLNIELSQNGDTVLTGVVLDQAALHGHLKKIRNSGMPLISVNRIQTEKFDSSTVKQSKEMINLDSDSHQYKPNLTTEGNHQR